MSANNWSICPQCIDNKQCKDKKEELKVSELYGVIPFEKFKGLSKNIEMAKLKLITKETLAEYYEIGILGDIFGVEYRAICHKCGFEKRFEIIEKLRYDNEG